MQSVKCIVVGDGAVGKTSLMIAHTYSCFLQDYVPTVFDNFAAVLKVGDRPVNICLWDTAGQEDYDKVRHASYRDSDIALLLFSVVSPASYENLKGKWFPEVRKFCPDIPIILVGTKNDLRNDEAQLQKLSKNNKKPITEEDAWSLVKKYSAVTYVECSSVNQSGVRDVFFEVLRTFLNVNEGKKAS